MGRPKGAWSEKRFKEALQAAVSEKHEGKPRLRLIAEQLTKAAMNGDVAAIKEVADRLDGKAHQSMDVAVTDERMVVSAPQPDESVEDWANRNKPH